MSLSKAKPATVVTEEQLQVIRIKRDPNAVGQLDGEVAFRGRSAAWDILTATKTGIIVPQLPSAKAAVTAALAGLGITGTVETSDLESLQLPVEEVLVDDAPQSPRVFQIAPTAFVKFEFTNNDTDGVGVLQIESAEWALTAGEQTALFPLIAEAKAALNA